MHLGPLGKTHHSKVAHRRIAPYAATGDNGAGNWTILAPADGHIRGAVKIAGAPVEGLIVRLYYRDNGILIAQAKTASDGSYRFDGLNKTDLKAYMITFVDPRADAPYNYTVTKDHLTAG